MVYWFATASFPEGAHTDDELGDLAARYRGWRAPIPQLLDATPPEALLRHDIYHLKTSLPRYVEGRVALLGDAAHAITPDLGQGACLALEDAVTLAAMITREADVRPPSHIRQSHAVTLAAMITREADVLAALAAYDRARKARTQRLVQVSWKAGRVAQWRNPPAVAFRDTLARLVPPSAYLRSMSDTFSWRPPSTDPATT